MRRYILPFVVMPAATITAFLYLAAIPGCAPEKNEASTPSAVSMNSKETSPSGVAASVNGEKIMISDISSEAMQKSGSAILDQLIGNTLIHQTALKENITVTPAELDSRIADIRDMMKPNKLEDQLKQHHMSLNDMRKELRVEMEVEKLAGNLLPQIKMRHICEILVRVRPNGTPPMQGDFMHTATEAKVIVNKIQSGLNAGMRFEDLAKKYSDDSANKDKGGDIGIIADVPDSVQDFSARALCSLPSVYHAIFTLKSGDITRTPLASSYGYHFIKVVSVADDQSPSEKELYKTETSKARESQFKVIAPKFVQSLREKANVEIYLGTYKVGPAGVAATVNGENIMVSQVSDMALKLAGPSVLDNKITDLIVEQEAKKQNVKVEPAEVDASINEIRNQLKPKTLEDALSQKHMTLNDLRESQMRHILAGKLVVKSIGPQKLVHAKHILILTKGMAASGIPGAKPHTETEALAIIAKIQKRLRTGDTFEDLAKQYSQDINTQKHGGDLGIIQRMNPFGMAVFTAAQSLKKGEVTSKPVKSDYGFHLIKAESTDSDYPAKEKQLYANGEKSLKAAETQMFLRGYLESKRGQSKVVNYLE